MLDEMNAGYEGQRRVEPRQDEGRVLARKEMLILAVCRASVEVLRGVPTVCAPQEVGNANRESGGEKTGNVWRRVATRTILYSSPGI